MLTVNYRMMTLYHRMLTLYYRLLTIVTFYYQGLDLDLTYICDRVIGMSMPCVSDAVYRNDIKEVSSRYTPHPTPYTLHPTPCTLLPTPYTLHPAPCTLHNTPNTLHPTPYTIHPGLACKELKPQNPKP